MIKRTLIPACALAAVFSSDPAHALLETCAVTAGAVAFGTYAPSSVTPLDASADITVTCTAVLSIAVNYTISLGSGITGNYAARQMTSGAQTLNYNLYTNSSRSIVWGDGSGGTGVVSDGYALGLLVVARSYPVYGRIPAQQNIAPGLYADTVVITVEY